MEDLNRLVSCVFNLLYMVAYITWLQSFLPEKKKKKSRIQIKFIDQDALDFSTSLWNCSSQRPTLIGDFHNVFKFHAYSLNKRLFLTTAKLAGACLT